MKVKVISLVILLCMIFSAVSCTVGDGTPTQAPTEAPTQPPQTLVLEPNIIDDGCVSWYQIYVKSFFDTDGDGIGDLRGVEQKLDYIKELGYNGIMLMPVIKSQTYSGKDAEDFCKIDPSIGNTEDFDALVSSAHKKGIKVIIDLDLNTTGAGHEYFRSAVEYIKANGIPGGKYGDYYVFSQQEAPGFVGIEGTDYFYKTSAELPKLNLDSNSLREDIVKIILYWLCDRDIDGFRLSGVVRYYFDDSKNIEFLSWLCCEAKKINSDCLLIGQVSSNDDTAVTRYFGSGLDSIQLFTSADATGALAGCLKIQSGEALGVLMESLQNTYGENTVLTYISDESTGNRPASYMSGIENIKMLTGIQMIMNGGISTFYGDEIGMISRGSASNATAKLAGFKWTDDLGGSGYCNAFPDVETSYIYASAQKQQNDKNSIYSFYKQMLYIRNCLPSIARGTVENIELNGNGSVCVIKKTYGEEQIIIVVNLAVATDPTDPSSGVRDVKLDQKLLAYQGIAAQVCAYDNKYQAVYDAQEELLSMPPYSIVILK